MDDLFEENKSVFSNTKCGNYRRFIWELMGERSTSRAAKIVFYTSFFIWATAIAIPDAKIKVNVELTNPETIKLTKLKQYWGVSSVLVPLHSL